MLVFIFHFGLTFFIIWSNVFGSVKFWTVYSLELTGHHRRQFYFNSRCLTSWKINKNKVETVLWDTLYKKDEIQIRRVSGRGINCNYISQARRQFVISFQNVRGILLPYSSRYELKTFNCLEIRTKIKSWMKNFSLVNYIYIQIL